ncbi:MAG: HAD family hydrolase [Solirubrobacterales bacterium]
MLVLVDIDGTLLRGSAAHRAALVHGVAEGFGVELDVEALDRILVPGSTDTRIARELLELVGAPEADGPIHLERFAPLAIEHFARNGPEGLEDQVIPGARQGLEAMRERGDTLALLTGNIEEIAHEKMARAGLGGFFARGQGAFGSDEEDRNALVPVARRHASVNGEMWPADQTVVVGDTPRDIACARAGGARAIAVTTGPYDADELAEADAVVGSLHDASIQIAAWHASDPAD